MATYLIMIKKKKKKVPVKQDNKHSDAGTFAQNFISDQDKTEPWLDSVTDSPLKRLLYKCIEDEFSGHLRNETKSRLRNNIAKAFIDNIILEES